MRKNDSSHQNSPLINKEGDENISVEERLQDWAFLPERDSSSADRKLLNNSWSDLYRMIHDDKNSKKTILDYIYSSPHEVEAPIANGDTPFRLALRTGCDFDVISAMIEVAPNASKDKGYPTPFMEALCPEPTICTDPMRVDVDMEVIETLIHFRPEAVRNPLALGYLCSKGNPSVTSLELVKLLISHCPNAVQTTNGATNRNMLPLHSACESGMSIDVVRYLLNLFPAASSTKCEPCNSMITSKGSYVLDVEARLPIELACVSKSPSVDVVKLLTERQTKNMKQMNPDGYDADFGKLLLLIAWATRKSYLEHGKDGTVQRPNYKEIIEYLLPMTNSKERLRVLNAIITENAWDDAQSFEYTKLLCDCTSVNGTMVLHAAVERGLINISKLICDISPSLARKRDRNGCLPLHIASTVEKLHSTQKTPMAEFLKSANRRKVVIQRILIAKYPRALVLKNHEGRIPCEMAGRYASGTVAITAKSSILREDFLAFCTKKHDCLRSREGIEKVLLHEKKKIHTNPRRRYSYTILFHELVLEKSSLYKRYLESPRERAKRRVLYLEELLECMTLTYGKL